MTDRIPIAETARIPILLVEDTLSAEERSRRLLGPSFSVHRAPDSSSAATVLEEMAAHDSFPKCVIVDLTLERNYSDALPLIMHFHKVYPRLPIIVWTKHSDDVIAQAMDRGATVALKKYVNDKEMRKVVTDLISKSEKSEEDDRS